MNAQTRLTNRLASLVVGVGLAMVGLVFVALGITFLPVIGILIAAPVMGLSFHFINPKIEVEEAREENALCCAWPREAHHSAA